MPSTRTWVLLVVLLLVFGQPAGSGETRGLPLGLDLHMPVPDENPLTAEKVALGRRLFSDRRLSRDGRLSCASCHDPQRAFTDGRSVSLGAGGRRGTRNAPTLINRGYGLSQFWDGRAASLEAQVVQPIMNPTELNMRIDEAVR